LTSLTRILLVDDYELIRSTLARCLKGAGYDVIEAGDGAEALLLLNECAPDAIICDVSMPVMDGLELRAKLQADGRFQSIPFLFLTARDSEEEVLLGLDLEPDDYLSKNTPQAVLIKKIDTVIKRHRAERKAATADLAQASIDAGVQLLPGQPPAFAGFSIGQFHKPYQEIPGGDFFDYIRVNETSLIIVLGDVMGKKWSAWMFAHAYMAYVRSAIRSLASGEDRAVTPAEILRRLNTMICNDASTAEVLCTMSIIKLSSKSSDILYATAAHIPALCCRRSTGKVVTLQHSGAPIGFRTESEYRDRVIAMAEGDRLLLMTDGITEACDHHGNGYGEEAIVDAIYSHRDDPRILEMIYEGALGFSSSIALDDDATLLDVQKVAS
jgi:sigma-B regulation protein RsbU (phosphoserine phosphatase)